MKTLLTSMMTPLFLFLSTSAIAAKSPMKPGLWEVNTTIKMGDKELNPHAEIEKSMVNMPEEQRKQMAAMMAKSGAGLGGGGMKVCYTQETLAQKDFGPESKRHCTSTVKEQTTWRTAMDFKCEDGTTGTGEWNFRSPTAYDGKMKFTKKDGKATDMTIKGHFINASCGDVKPIHIPKS